MAETLASEETPNLSLIDASVAQEAIAQREPSAELVKAVNTLQIQSASDLSSVVTVYNEVHQRHKTFDEQRLQAGRKLREVQKLIDSWFNPTLKSLEAVKEVLGAKMSQFLDGAAEVREKAIAAMAEADETKAQQLLVIADQANFEKVEGLTLTRDAIISIDESLLPDEFWTIDEKKLKAAAKAGIAIPGVTVRRPVKVQPRASK